MSNRVAVSSPFTQSINTWNKVDAYTGMQAAASARSLLVSVTSDPATVTVAAGSLSAVMKTVGITGTVQTSAAGDTIKLGTPGSHVDVIAYNAASFGKSDTVVSFSGDRIDVSALGFTGTGVTVKAAGTDATQGAGFFGSNGVAILTEFGGTAVYIDANKDRSYTAAADIVVHVVGAAVTAGDIWS